jgi:hypothetical protein
MSFPFDGHRMLVGAPLGVPLRVSGILFDGARQHCAEQGIRLDDVITCRERSPHHALVEIAGRGARWLSSALAVCIEVEPAERSAADRLVGTPAATTNAA